MVSRGPGGRYAGGGGDRGIAGGLRGVGGGEALRLGAEVLAGVEHDEGPVGTDRGNKGGNCHGEAVDRTVPDDGCVEVVGGERVPCEESAEACGVSVVGRFAGYACGAIQL